ncbi:TetR family transcriptional regulator [Streptomonospora sp. S1-112]|uniref:TetR family transcriptional regulator n=1 Tax=Streptomonospora mangrovi TaxID=2883123 RepID=A0A9X3NHA1_9ACTN|nr:TetR family transcriptional regulator [Streptomonospora mangrovi]MDA0563617.1 TetR family transcriptional regulator [Streptomonospora mangrovi]
MSTVDGRLRRAAATREHILDTAERLFAERGVVAVSNRQISEAAGQGNTAAVGYHFGTKADLVRAIARRHADDIERRRKLLLARTDPAAGVREWVACLVRPVTEHLGSLGVPSWYARFGAQLATDPALRGILTDQALTTPSLREVVDRLNRRLPDLPLEVHAERAEMAGQLLVHMCAERERALARGAPTAKPDWHGTATGLIDAITAIWHAEVTPAEVAGGEAE